MSRRGVKIVTGVWGGLLLAGTIATMRNNFAVGPDGVWFVFSRAGLAIMWNQRFPRVAEVGSYEFSVQPYMRMPRLHMDNNMWDISIPLWSMWSAFALFTFCAWQFVRRREQTSRREQTKGFPVGNA